MRAIRIQQIPIRYYYKRLFKLFEIKDNYKQCIPNLYLLFRNKN